MIVRTRARRRPGLGTTCMSAVAVVGLLAASACGSDDDDSSSVAADSVASDTATDDSSTDDTVTDDTATADSMVDDTATDDTMTDDTATDDSVADGAAAGGTCDRPLTLATVTGDSGSQGYLADELGYYEDNGLDMTVEIVAGVAELAAAVQSGDAEFALTAPNSVAAANAGGIPFRMVAAGALYTADVPGTRLMVATDSGIESYADLVGKKVAVNALNTGPHLSALAALDDAGVNIDDVEFVVLNFPAIGPAIESGQVDGGVVVSPFDEQIEASGVGVSIGSPYDAINDSQDFMNTVWFTTEDFVESDPDCVAQFRSAIVDVSEWANDAANTEERKGYLQEYSGLSDEALETLDPLFFGLELDPALIQPQYDNMVRFGALEEAIDASTLIAAPE